MFGNVPPSFGSEIYHCSPWYRPKNGWQSARRSYKSRLHRISLQHLN
jgi:hypothetical protein